MTKEKTQIASGKVRAVAVTVAGGAEAFYRGGRRWTKDPQTVVVSDLTESQLTAIRAEPMLQVVDAEIIATTTEEAVE